MGVSFNICNESKEYTLSLVKWGIFRKLLAKIFNASPFIFIPSYELAIYEKKEGKIKYNNPCFVFHYINKEIATSRMNWAKELLIKGGMESLVNNLKKFDPEKEVIYSDLTDYIERGGLY